MVSNGWRIFNVVIVAGTAAIASAQAEESRVAASLYLGAATDHIASDIFGNGRFVPNGGVAVLAVDTRLFDLGPSYTDDPPFSFEGPGNSTYTGQRVKWLNYVGIELAAPLPRINHRSGEGGLYSHAVGEGSSIGLGVRRRF